MNAYTIAFYTHISMVVISGGFFLLRGFWMIQESNLLRLKPVKILPHIVDTILLISAFSLAYQLQTYPFADNWLTGKFLALIAYIGFGVLTLRGPTKPIRIAMFATAIVTFSYMLMVALTKHPLGWFA